VEPSGSGVASTTPLSLILFESLEISGVLASRHTFKRPIWRHADRKNTVSIRFWLAAERVIRSPFPQRKSSHTWTSESSGGTTMIFRDRVDAGRQLARLLAGYANKDDVIVLGIPRGGVAVALEVARVLGASLDIFLSRKLGVPGNEELAFGSVADGDGPFLDRDMIDALGISKETIQHIVRETREKLKERASLYRGDRPPLSVESRRVILVDDGVATGSSAYAAIHALRLMRPAKMIVAVPVAPRATGEWLKTQVDEFLCLRCPRYFGAVGQFYESFQQVSDEEVIALLHEAGWAGEGHSAASEDTPAGGHGRQTPQREEPC
jgi:putative phosphoribosyl transferase